MCGIIGYLGDENSVPIMIEGLYRLEYRGYDSAGIAIINKNKEVIIDKIAGRVKGLENKINGSKHFSKIGIAHTRWATHGAPNDINAHPHLDCTGNFAVVHNGIIENYRALKIYLEKKGHHFNSETDTEVLAHLFEEYYKKENDLFESVRKALLKVEGTYGIAVISKFEPERIIAARKGSPLLVGRTENNEYFIASDLAAIIRYTNNIIYLDEGEIANIHKNDRLKIRNIESNIVSNKNYEKIDMELSEIEKRGYPHFMLKEINEQNFTLLNAIRGRLDYENGDVILAGLEEYRDYLRDVERIILTGCGTSWHAALLGEYLIEKLANLPVEVEYASEFRYRNPIIEDKTAVFVISQSGETADTLAALREAKKKGAKVFGICNVVGSTIARETDAGVYIHAGPEIGVASTKAFTSQVMVLILIAIMMGRWRKLSLNEGKKLVDEIEKLPRKVEDFLKQSQKIKEYVKYFDNLDNALFLGRQLNYPVALEGALKLKEISYIHAEGYPAAEMKHGPIALIDEKMPTIIIATEEDFIYDKIVSNIEEIKARKGRVIVIAVRGNKNIKELSDSVIYVPKTID
ncbi:MAG: glutamine--fructose-6-phosphate transaminase (isomerizing), partial [Candidatus Mcinerneyibacterium aminivorans]